MSSSDHPVQSTDCDALLSRISCSELGYTTNDDYSSLFLPSRRRSLTPTPPPRRPPLINLGTHLRTIALDSLVNQFLSSNTSLQPKQIISLGAGTDSRFWRLQGELQQCHHYVEVDFQESTSNKARSITTHHQLKDKLGGNFTLEQGGTRLLSPRYSLLPCDLRQVDQLSSAILNIATVDPSLPTLLLTECVLVYLPPHKVNNILQWFTKAFSHPASSAISYDPFGLHDQFGTVMRNNLATRNLSLPSAESTPTLASLNHRLLSAGFSTAGSLTLKQIRERVIDPQEAARVARIEQIDEVEELNLVLDHYAVSWGSVGPQEVIGLKMR